VHRDDFEKDLLKHRSDGIITRVGQFAGRWKTWTASRRSFRLEMGGNNDSANEVPGQAAPAPGGKSHKYRSRSDFSIQPRSFHEKTGARSLVAVFFIASSMPAAKAVEYTGKSLRDPFSDAETALSAQKATPSEVTLEILSLDLQGIVLYPHGKSQAIIDGNIVTEGSQLKRGKSAHHQSG